MFCGGDYLIAQSPAARRHWNRIPGRVYESMRERAEAVTGHPMPMALSYFEQCLLMLFLALECEDEAKAPVPPIERKNPK